MTPQEALKSFEEALEGEHLGLSETMKPEFDAIAQALDDYEELKDSFEALEKKCAMYDYWRENCMKNDKILAIIKNKVMPLVNLEDDTTICRKGRFAVYDNELYQSEDLTQEEYDLLKGWLGK